MFAGHLLRMHRRRATHRHHAGLGQALADLGAFSTSLNAAFSLATMGSGVAAGTQMPYENANTRSGTPTSASVGTSGNEGERACPPCASALIRPSLIMPR